MPYCAAFGCSSKAKAGSGASFFSFSKDPRICRIWMTRISRKNFRLSQHSKLCSKHFDPDQYERDPAKLAQYGYHKALPSLKQNAVPTVFPHKAEKTTVQRSRAAVEKRRNGKILVEFTSEAARNLPGENSEPSSSYSVLQNNQTEPMEELNEVVGERESAQVEMPVFNTHKDAGFQICLRVPKRTRSNQYRCKELCPVTKIETCSKATQCCLIKGVPLELLGNTEYCSESSNDSEDSSDEFDPEFVPDMFQDEGDDDEDMDVDDPDYFSLKQEPLTADKEPHVQKKFLVFEESLLEILEPCRECSGKCTVNIVRQMGTMITVSGVCPQGHRFSWCSQPMHDQMPWGNLLLASTILFSGSSPTKLISSLDNLKVPIFCTRTFSYIQRLYLAPAVREMWEQHQVVQLHASDGPLLLGG